MKHSDFHIGLEFLGIVGFRWRCTDVGTRTILAIQLDHDDANWYRGPPYVAQEVVFDEHEIERCHLTEEEAIKASIHEADTSAHPGYPNDDVNHMMLACFEEAGTPYPRKGLLRFDRRTPDGDILHSYAARKDGEQWAVRLYLPFQRTNSEMSECDFIALPIATATDVQARADRIPPCNNDEANV